MSFPVSFGGYLHVGDDPVHHGIAEGISLEHVSKDFEVSQHDPDVIFGFDSIEVPNKELQQVVLLQIELNPVESWAALWPGFLHYFAGVGQDLQEDEKVVHPQIVQLQK